jgi:hypothetical protein
MKTQTIFSLLILLSIALYADPPTYQKTNEPMTPSWHQVTPGIEVATVTANLKCSVSDSKIIMARIDQLRWQPDVLVNQWKTAGDIALANYMVVVNAGMYLPGGLPVGYTRVRDTEIQSKWATGYKGAFVYDNVKAHIVTVTKPTSHPNMFQSFRMITEGRNMCSPVNKYFSICAIAVDYQGKILTIHSRTPYSIVQFNQLVLDMNIGVRNMIYLEGGPEASMKVGNNTYVGSYETGFWENNNNKIAWDLPNMLAFRPRE